MPRRIDYAGGEGQVKVALGSSLGEGQKWAWRPIYCSGYDVLEDGTKEYHHFSKKYERQPTSCGCTPGPHYLMLFSTAYEIAAGGGRGSGKSEMGYAMSLRGNLHRYIPGTKTKYHTLPSEQLRDFDYSYLNHPKFRGLVLRKNAADLNDWLSRAKRFYDMVGGRVTENPARVIFPSGAQFVAGHLKDEDSFLKYQGQEFQFLWIEELSLIPEESTYINTLQSIRSSIEGIKEQVYVTFNPGGPGAQWIKDRFVYPRGDKGEKIPWGQRWWYKMAPEKTRVFFHSTVDDNPYFLRNNAAYVQSLDMLALQSEGNYRRQRLGDFDAVDGAYFPMYRDAHRAGEPQNACHVVTQADIKPWWPKHIAMDWGYDHNSCVLKGVICPNGQFIVMDEIVAKGIGSVEWGVRIAEWVREDLKGQWTHCMNLWLSPDVCGRRDDTNTIAQQIEAGVRKVLGPDAAFIIKSDDDEEDIFRRHEFQTEKARIIIRPAKNQRIFGWQFMRDMLQWRSFSVEKKAEKFSHEYANELMQTHGFDAYKRYLDLHREKKAEPLPKLLVSANCRRVREAIPSAIHDNEHAGREEDVLKTPTLHDDVLDCLRYLCMGYKHHIEKMPPGEYAKEKLEIMLQRDPTLTPASQYDIKRNAFEEWAKQFEVPAGFTVRRVGSSEERIWRQ